MRLGASYVECITRKLRRHVPNWETLGLSVWKRTTATSEEAALVVKRGDFFPCVVDVGTWGNLHRCLVYLEAALAFLPRLEKYGYFVADPRDLRPRALVTDNAEADAAFYRSLI